MDEKIGFVPLQNLGPGLLFSNFVAENKEGEAHALCYNISEESITIKAPTVTSEPCEVMREKDGFLDIDHINDDEDFKFGQANALRVHSKEETDRVAKIFEAIDPDTLKGLNTEEIQRIQNLIKERSHFWTHRGKIKSYTFSHT